MMPLLLLLLLLLRLLDELMVVIERALLVRLGQRRHYEVGGHFVLCCWDSGWFLVVVEAVDWDEVS